MLTPTREDYLEAIHQLSEEDGEVRITDLAGALGCRLPTVTRTVRAMAVDGWVLHDTRKSVRLSRQGRQAALQLVRRHEVAKSFLQLVLGLPTEAARKDARRLRHGLSPEVCQRMHAWLLHLERLDPALLESALAYAVREEDPTSAPPESG